MPVMSSKMVVDSIVYILYTAKYVQPQRSANNRAVADIVWRCTMSVISPEVGSIYTVRIYKSHTLNPSLKWSNTYEVRLDDFAETSMLVDGLTILLDFERRIHHELTIVS